MSNAMNTNFKVALETVPNMSGQFHLLPQFSCIPELGQGSGAHRLWETTWDRREQGSYEGRCLGARVHVKS